MTRTLQPLDSTLTGGRVLHWCCVLPMPCRATLGIFSASAHPLPKPPRSTFFSSRNMTPTERRAFDRLKRRLAAAGFRLRAAYPGSLTERTQGRFVVFCPYRHQVIDSASRIEELSRAWLGV